MLYSLNHVALFGRYYGFPSCCVKDFVDGKSHAYRLRKKRHLDGTGFIPCYQCQRKKTATQLMEEIQRNRICSLPFPEQHDEFDDGQFQEILASPLFTDIEKGFIIGFFQYLVLPEWEETLDALE